jgi:tRNA1(Val) A37 N6-methylase TrmN6
MELNDKEYWENYYKKNFKLSEPSTFIHFASSYIKNNKKLIELGCGNGKDSIFFQRRI